MPFSKPPLLLSMSLRCSTATPEQPSDGHDSDDPMLMIAVPEKLPIAVRMVFRPSPEIFVLLGSVHVAVILMVEAGRSTVDGAVMLVYGLPHGLPPQV